MNQYVSVLWESTGWNSTAALVGIWCICPKLGLVYATPVNSEAHLLLTVSFLSVFQICARAFISTNQWLCECPAGDKAPEHFTAALGSCKGILLPPLKLLLSFPPCVPSFLLLQHINQILKKKHKNPKTQQTQTTNQPQILKSTILLPFITDSYWFLTLFLKRAAFLPYLQLIYHCYNCGWKVSLYGLSIWTLPVALLNREHCETVLRSCKMQHNLTNRLTLCWNIYPFLIAVLKWQLDFALPQVKSCLHVKGDRQACCQK